MCGKDGPYCGARTFLSMTRHDCGDDRGGGEQDDVHPADERRVGAVGDRRPEL
jgi:hypothetical protein